MIWLICDSDACSRYGLYDHKRQLALGLEGELRPLVREDDPEIRADELANVVLKSSLQKQICYDPATTLQVLADLDTVCSGAG